MTGAWPFMISQMGCPVQSQRDRSTRQGRLAISVGSDIPVGVNYRPCEVEIRGEHCGLRRI